MTTKRREAFAAKKADAAAIKFYCSLPCSRCGTHWCYISNFSCCNCKKGYSVYYAKRLLEGAEPCGTEVPGRLSQLRKRLDSAFKLFTTTDLGLYKSASLSQITPKRLKKHLLEQGVEPCKCTREEQPGRQRPYGSGSASNATKAEFVEARVSIKASRLLDEWYRSTHGKPLKVV
jgi:hypothetical protein